MYNSKSLSSTTTKMTEEGGHLPSSLNKRHSGATSNDEGESKVERVVPKVPSRPAPPPHRPAPPPISRPKQEPIIPSSNAGAAKPPGKRRLEITVLDARPMSEVGFRSTPAKPPKSPESPVGSREPVIAPTPASRPVPSARPTPAPRPQPAKRPATNKKPAIPDQPPPPYVQAMLTSIPTNKPNLAPVRPVPPRLDQSSNTSPNSQGLEGASGPLVDARANVSEKPKPLPKRPMSVFGDLSQAKPISRPPVPAHRPKSMVIRSNVDLVDLSDPEPPIPRLRTTSLDKSEPFIEDQPKTSRPFRPTIIRPLKPGKQTEPKGEDDVKRQDDPSGHDTESLKNETKDSDFEKHADKPAILKPKPAISAKPSISSPPPVSPKPKSLSPPLVSPKPQSPVSTSAHDDIDSEFFTPPQSPSSSPRQSQSPEQSPKTLTNVKDLTPSPKSETDKDKTEINEKPEIAKDEIKNSFVAKLKPTVVAPPIGSKEWLESGGVSKNDAIPDMPNGNEDTMSVKNKVEAFQSNLPHLDEQVSSLDQLAKTYEPPKLKRPTIIRPKAKARSRSPSPKRTEIDSKPEKNEAAVIETENIEKKTEPPPKPSRLNAGPPPRPKARPKSMIVLSEKNKNANNDNYEEPVTGVLVDIALSSDGESKQENLKPSVTEVSVDDAGNEKASPEKEAPGSPGKKVPPARPGGPPPKPPSPLNAKPKQFKLQRSLSEKSSGPMKAKGPPALPERPGPEHPLFHYVATGPRGVALFDYEAQQSDEISFQVGDVVLLIRKIDPFWYYGKVKNKEGLFPTNFVEVVEQLPKEEKEDTEAVKIQAEKTTTPTASDQISGPRCMARFDFEGENDSDLSFMENDVIKLMERSGDEWLKGELNGKTGLFPVTFVEIIEDLPTNEGANPDQQESAAIHALDQALTAWDDDPPVVGDKGGDQSIANMKASEKNNDLFKKDGHIVMKTLFDFDGENGELTFKAGDEISVINQVNSDWLTGKIGGTTGIFPASFIGDIPENLPSCDNNTAPPFEEDVNKKEVQYYAIATFPFEAQSDSDLSFNTGDRIAVNEQIDDDWLSGTIGSRSGVFPKNFVEIEKTSPQETSPSSGLIRTSSNSRIKTPERPIVTPQGRVVYDFTAEAEGELSMSVGQTVYLLEHVNAEWMKGTIDNDTGNFPVNYIEIITPLPESPKPDEYKI
ncbi:unnamed protein product [Owenia fusiformis]|uniref:Uncharacterized protein n=1 Tax=Owenia fusiformis TaxID=6347 RepID=A0A8J1XL35_OWEFU|nr:unnamed protein product [Owenia fusiformis]